MDHDCCCFFLLLFFLNLSQPAPSWFRSKHRVCVQQLFSHLYRHARRRRWLLLSVAAKNTQALSVCLNPSRKKRRGSCQRNPDPNPNPNPDPNPDLCFCTLLNLFPFAIDLPAPFLLMRSQMRKAAFLRAPLVICLCPGASDSTLQQSNSVSHHDAGMHSPTPPHSLFLICFGPGDGQL